jgi:hypothetical protein
MSLPKLDYNHSMSEQLLVGATRLMKQTSVLSDTFRDRHHMSAA